jgi:hypothetical protein
MPDTAISKNTKFLAASRRNCDTGNGRFLPWVLAVATAALLLHGVPASAQQLSPDQTRAIAKEATIYGFPLVDSYRKPCQTRPFRAKLTPLKMSASGAIKSPYYKSSPTP